MPIGPQKFSHNSSKGRAGIYEPLGPRITRSELVHNFPIFLGHGPFLVPKVENYLILVRFGSRIGPCITGGRDDRTQNELKMKCLFKNLFMVFKNLKTQMSSITMF